MVSAKDGMNRTTVVVTTHITIQIIYLKNSVTTQATKTLSGICIEGVVRQNVTPSHTLTF